MPIDDCEHAAAEAEIARLVKHAEYLRQINSNKAFRLQRRNRWMTIATVAVASAVTFVGFAGTARLREQLQAPLGWSQQAIDFGYNSLVLSVLLLTIVALIYRLPDRAAEHEQAILGLTRFIRANDAQVRAAQAGAASLTLKKARRVRMNYLALTSSLPPSTDREFSRAKRDFAKKKSETRDSGAGVQPAGPAEIASCIDHGSSDLGKRLIHLLHRDPVVVALLRELSSFGMYELWLAGGVVRNLVWDELHERGVATPIEDVDVVWFDAQRAHAEVDKNLERCLSDAIPNVRWDVKNQARMSDAKRLNQETLEESLKSWPETASAVAVRIRGGQIEILAPLGLEDLYGLLLRYPEDADARQFHRRLEEKKWLKRWPKLAVSSPVDGTPQTDRRWEKARRKLLG